MYKIKIENPSIFFSDHPPNFEIEGKKEEQNKCYKDRWTSIPFEAQNIRVEENWLRNQFSQNESTRVAFVEKKIQKRAMNSWKRNIWYPANGNYSALFMAISMRYIPTMIASGYANK